MARSCIFFAIIYLASGIHARVVLPEANNWNDIWREIVEIPQEVAENIVPIARAGSCSIGTNNGDLTAKQPLLIKPGTSEIVLPSKTGEITHAAGAAMDLYCTSNFAKISKKKVTATCVGGKTYRVDGKDYDFSELECASAVAHTARKTTRRCNDDGTILEIGFDVEGRFIQTIEVCHNLAKEVTYYVHYSLYPSSIAFQKSVARPTFIPGGFYNGKDVNKLYTQVSQMETAHKILGADYEKYFDLKKNVYMARGHMAAKADFIYAPEQMATFYFINAAPQWQVFNAGNWERVEDGVKKFAASRDSTFDVYTGTWGVLELPDSAGKNKPLYLAFDGNTGLIPVPKLYYRVVIEPSTKKGIVLVGVNNPFATEAEIKRDYMLCNDVSDKIDWIGWKKHDIKAGYSYACEVPQFLQAVKQLPTLQVSGPLY